MESITAEGLSDLLARGGEPSLIDVREPWEFELCRIQGSRNIPMSEIPGEIAALDKDRNTVVICHHGMRSLQVAGYLEESGFQKVINLEGGIDAWASQIDPDMPQY
ncbi:MAG: rhodanese-like domain-containing protein [Gammaproteobacteria bacterium]